MIFLFCSFIAYTGKIFLKWLELVMGIIIYIYDGLYLC